MTDPGTIAAIRAELGPRFEYSQTVNGFGVLICAILDRETGRTASSNSVNFGASPFEDARHMREMLLDLAVEVVGHAS